MKNHITFRRIRQCQFSSNLLRHFHQIRIISFIETVVGQILSPGFITKNLAPGHVPDKEKGQVKIEMNIDKRAVYLEKFKVYPSQVLIENKKRDISLLWLPNPEENWLCSSCSNHMVEYFTIQKPRNNP